jgi:microcystin-dependent protein
LAGTTSSTGTGGGVDNRQPYLGVYFCIALQGLFPSRS